MEDEQLRLCNQVCFPIYSVSKLITKAYKPHLDPMGLTYPQYLVMMVLWETDDICINQISEKLLLETNTLSPLLKRMESNRVIERIRNTQDTRVVHIKLTSKGKSLKEQALEIPHKLGGKLLTPNIQMQEVIQLKDTLEQWIEILKKQD